jgi:hypothetical protein
VCGQFECDERGKRKEQRAKRKEERGKIKGGEGIGWAQREQIRHAHEN